MSLPPTATGDAASLRASPAFPGVATSPPHARARRLSSAERAVSGVELVALVGLQVFVVWQGLWLLSLPGFVPVAGVAFSLELLYFAYLSPVWLHRDSLADRGLGTWRTLFVRTDNLLEAARGFGALAVGGTIAVLLVASIWKPDWTTRIDAHAWALRARSYSISVAVQTLAIVGFGLPRLKSIFTPSRSQRAGAVTATQRQRMLVSLVVAALFAGLHAPYPPFMALSSAFGFALAWLSLRTPNVFAAACCQFVLGLQVSLVLGLSMRVGVFHTHPEVRFLKDIFSWADRALGVIAVTAAAIAAVVVVLNWKKRRPVR